MNEDLLTLTLKILDYVGLLCRYQLSNNVVKQELFFLINLFVLSENLDMGLKLCQVCFIIVVCVYKISLFVSTSRNVSVVK